MPMMSRRLDEEDEAVLPSRRSNDREMTLGTGAILGIFFGLVVLLGAFFGFGYKMGSSSAGKGLPPAAANESSAPAEASNPEKFSNFKPSAASPAVTSSETTNTGESGPPALTPPPGSVVAAHPAQPPASSAPAHQAPPPAPALPASTSAVVTAASNAALAATAPAGIYVQVSAASRKETADLLIKDLHDKGITAFTRSIPGDNFIHIQVGPFVTKKDAEAMKERISAAGYNPILK
jgi:DedD protein